MILNDYDEYDDFTHSQKFPTQHAWAFPFMPTDFKKEEEDTSLTMYLT